MSNELLIKKIPVPNPKIATIIDKTMHIIFSIFLLVDLEFSSLLLFNF